MTLLHRIFLSSLTCSLYMLFSAAMPVYADGSLDGTNIGASSAKDATFTAATVNGQYVNHRAFEFNVTSATSSPTTTSGGNCAGDLVFTIPSNLNGFTISTVTASVSTVTTSGTLALNIRNRTDNVNVLSSAVTISTGASSGSSTSISQGALATNDQLCVQVSDAATGGKGLNVVVEARK